MNFTRTPAGLSNQHRFHRVDYVVFVEGGDESFSFEQVCAGDTGKSSPDIVFWRHIFKRFSEHLSVVFKPVGSKSTLRRIADKVATNEVTHVFVAMDQDVDRFCGRMLDAKGVFYTWGYSWENDICQQDILVDIVLTLTPMDAATVEPQIRSVLSTEIGAFQKQLARFARIDVLFKTHDGSLFPSKKYVSLVKSKSSHSTPPVLDVSKLKTLLRQKRAWSRNRRPFSLPADTVFQLNRDVFGHLYCTYCYRLLLHVFKTYAAVPTMALVNATALASSILAKEMSSTQMPEIYNHYAQQFACAKN